MTSYLITLSCTFFLFVAAALVVNFCKQRTARTKHPLSGMCHKDGGTMCCSCGSALQSTIPRHQTP
jgi:hypothetical protein